MYFTNLSALPAVPIYNYMSFIQPFYLAADGFLKDLGAVLSQNYDALSTHFIFHTSQSLGPNEPPLCNHS